MKTNEAKTAKKHHTAGRGSNPRSKQNLTGAKRNAFVYERGAGIGWSKLAGPMAYHEAYVWAMRLEKYNKTCQPLYAAMMGQV